MSVITTSTVHGLRQQEHPSLKYRACDYRLSTLTDNQGVVHFKPLDRWFSQKTAFFYVPGAFTPVCSKEHLRQIVAAVDKFRAFNINVDCVAINNRDTMYAWAGLYDPERTVYMVPDYQANLAQAFGLTSLG